MYGIASQRMTGLVPAHKKSGTRVMKYRYLRIYTPDNSRLDYIPYKYSTSPRIHGSMYSIDIRESLSGPNLILDTNISVYSDALDQQSVDTWIDRVRQGEAGFDFRLGYTIHTAPSLYIDFKTRRYLYKVSVLIMTNMSGVILYGSNDATRWDMIGDYSQSAILSPYGPVSTGYRWCNLLRGGNINTPPVPSSKHTSWGLLIGGSVGSRTYYTQIAYRETVGGVNLVGSGAIDPWVTCNSEVQAPFYDGDLNTSAYIVAGHGTAYAFTSPVLPASVAITAAYDVNYNPRDFAVVYSDNKTSWHVYKHFYTPDGTWPAGINTVEFVL